MHARLGEPRGLRGAGYDAPTMPTDTRWKPSVTVAAVVELGGRFLLVEEHTADGLRLNNPAGHLDPGESIVQAVVREVLEETACTFTPSHLVGVYLARLQHGIEDITYLRFAFAGTVGAPEPGRALDTGIVRALWLTPTEIEASRERHRSPLLWRCVQDHLAGQRYSLEVLCTEASVYSDAAP
jgi:8-oxo-dGTP pyrophosphatase MutT (NUDIX family)